jgi:hypothetical protein
MTDLTAVANLALDHLGEPYLTDYTSDTGTSADAVRLHLPQCVDLVLEGHAWSFATQCSQLSVAHLDEVAATATLGSGDAAILITAVTPGPSGNEISATIAEPALAAAITVSVVGRAIVAAPVHATTLTIGGTLTLDGSTPFVADELEFVEWLAEDMPRYANAGGTQSVSRNTSGNFTLWAISAGAFSTAWISTADVATPDLVPTGAYDSETNPDAWMPAYGGPTGTPVVSVSAASTGNEVLAAINAHETAGLLVLASLPADSDGTSSVAAVAATSLSGGDPAHSVYAPAFGSAFNLPADCLRLLKIDGSDIDLPELRFEIQGRNLLLPDAGREAPVVHYIAKDPPVTEWPSTFADAVALLLASRLAPKLAGDQKLADALLGRHEQALGKARSKDTRETRSNENHSPRQLAARSGLVQARYGSTRPPY